MKKFFIQSVIGALVASALLGIFIFLFGKFESTQVKLLFSTLSIGGCSLTGLCCANLYSKEKYKVFSIFGIGMAGLCLLIALLNIWGEDNEPETTWKMLLALIVVTCSFAHVSLLLNSRPLRKIAETVSTITIVFIATVAVMLVTFIYAHFENPEWFFRLLGTFAILDIAGTIITPLLNRNNS